ncbi:glycosyltransferase family 9 protein [Sinomonas sp. JGH33]|uniref:Glycosyltransferase family 9 protein n=1 Tax=Sinomonas terricola TaxID=3110330 RepID=A0ABU5T9R6_9MICC|nr:glycosyltransferase family 9 protein [Sinomonas sp. JGH33]MEA5456438.1 glycosyltransferase family 9 protein [Sinomonas sp. JGH33]
MRRVLVARLDGLGDLVLSGPAIRAVAARAEVVLMTGPGGAELAPLLPGVSGHIVWDCPWISQPAPPLTSAEVRRLERVMSRMAVDEAVILTSIHQSALPLAFELRLCGVRRITAFSEDYPGSLLDVRLTQRELPGELHEANRALGIAAAAGFPLPADDDGLPALVRQARTSLRPVGDYAVVHPGADDRARAWPPGHAAELVGKLAATGLAVVVTGSAYERALTRRVAGTAGIDVGGGTSLRALADLMSGARVVVAANAGPAHVAAAVRTPVVVLLSPVVSPAVWTPRGAPVATLGDPDEAFDAALRLIRDRSQAVA